MWYILNKIFGWDYIVWENSADRGISRVSRSPDGNVFYWRYRITCTVDYIKTPKDVKLWLTCPPSKYLAVPVEEK